MTAAPTLVFIDPLSEEPKVLKSMTSASPKSVKSEIDSEAKKMMKK